MNVVARLQKHLGNHSGYTAKFKDSKIIWRNFLNNPDALAREQPLKRWKNKEKNKQLIPDAASN